MLDKNDFAHIRYKRVNENTGKEVKWENIVKGYKIEDEYVILEDEDFEQANPKKSKTIDIEQFVNETEVEDVLFKKPYFVEPQKEGGKSYNLLRDALKKTGKLGVATFVMREKEHLSLIGVYKNILVLHIIRFEEEMRDTKEIKVTKTKVTKKEVAMAEALIKNYTETFKLSNFKDVYNAQLLKIIKAKQKGTQRKTKVIDTKPTASKDLMEQLKASLERKKKKAKAS